MKSKLISLVFKARHTSIRGLITVGSVFLLVGLTFSPSHAEKVWEPYVDLYAIHNDNIFFSATEQEDDYIYTIEPGIKFDSNQELSRITAEGLAQVRRYQEYDDLNNEVYRFNLDGSSHVTERFRLEGGYRFTKDTTQDSELDETGRIFTREDRVSHEARILPKYNLTELTSIGLSGRFRDVTYDSDSYVDYSYWDVSLPVWRRLATQVDSVFISPGYTYRDSETFRSGSYNMNIGWDHETTERLTYKISVGARYTELENLETGKKEESWNGVGSLAFNYDYEIGSVAINIKKELSNTADGKQIDVSRVTLALKWNLTERLGMGINGEYYYSQTEGEENNDATEFFRVGPSFSYNITEHHVFFISYQYAQENQKDTDDDEPRAERNRIWAGVRLHFPIH